jgi:hypothetical protein
VPSFLPIANGTNGSVLPWGQIVNVLPECCEYHLHIEHGGKQAKQAETKEQGGKPVMVEHGNSPVFLFFLHPLCDGSAIKVQLARNRAAIKSS